MTSNRSPRALLASLFFVAAVILAASPAHAHDTWLLPRTWTPAPGDSLQLDLTSGMHFPDLEAPMKPERIAHSGVRRRGLVRPLQVRTAGKKSLRLTAPLDSAGVYTMWAEAAPKFIELDSAHVEEYLDEIGARESVGKIWAAMPKPRRWTENYTKHAKLLLRVRADSVDKNWNQPVGIGLELVPESNPWGDWRRKEAFEVRLLREGHGVRDVTLSAHGDGIAELSHAITDSKGRASFHLRPGLWMISATVLRRSEDPPPQSAAWESDFTTLTLWILP